MIDIKATLLSLCSALPTYRRASHLYEYFHITRILIASLCYLFSIDPLDT